MPVALFQKISSVSLLSTPWNLSLRRAQPLPKSHPIIPGAADCVGFIGEVQRNAPPRSLYSSTSGFYYLGNFQAGLWKVCISTEASQKSAQKIWFVKFLDSSKAFMSKMSKLKFLFYVFFSLKKAWNFSHYKHLEIIDKKRHCSFKPIAKLAFLSRRETRCETQRSTRNNGARETARRLWTLAVLQEA